MGFGGWKPKDTDEEIEAARLIAAERVVEYVMNNENKESLQVSKLEQIIITALIKQDIAKYRIAELMGLHERTIRHKARSYGLPYGFPVKGCKNGKHWVYCPKKRHRISDPNYED